MYYYVGMNSECHALNYFHSFEMALAGAGYALSYPLARALAKNLDVCIRRHPSLYGSDRIVQSRVAWEFLSLRERGFIRKDPCQVPHVFYFDSDNDGEYVVATNYTRKRSRVLPACSSSGNHSAGRINKILVISPLKMHEDRVGRRRECCEVDYDSRSNTTKVKIRTCIEDEIIT
ncbi:hypothetical protein ACH5RR_020733 [Cinchona calisaya]|uniref:Uncharacterized protein n=1 Tax=Cinchona calisaya TaxID=153742 RepID=A0ABD2ZFA0_9GENT